MKFPKRIRGFLHNHAYSKLQCKTYSGWSRAGISKMKWLVFFEWVFYIWCFIITKKTKWKLNRKHSLVSIMRISKNIVWLFWNFKVNTYTITSGKTEKPVCVVRQMANKKTQPGTVVSIRWSRIVTLKLAVFTNIQFFQVSGTLTLFYICFAKHRIIHFSNSFQLGHIIT